jgi:hypothetical protein
MTMQLIQHQELGSAQASITFSSIPQTYTDLMIVTSLRDTGGTNGWTNAYIRPNGLSTNLTTRALYGFSSTTGSFSDTFIYHETVGGGSTSNTFSNSNIYIANYTSANAKSISVDTSTANNGGNAINAIVAGLWNSSAAITSLGLVAEVGNFAQYSSATLYGILKGSDGVTTVS